MYVYYIHMIKRNEIYNVIVNKDISGAGTSSISFDLYIPFDVSEIKLKYITYRPTVAASGVVSLFSSLFNNQKFAAFQAISDDTHYVNAKILFDQPTRINGTQTINFLQSGDTVGTLQGYIALAFEFYP
jgi:hypothetical protein